MSGHTIFENRPQGIMVLQQFKEEIEKKTFLSEEAKQKYRGMFETQKSGNKTSSGET